MTKLEKKLIELGYEKYHKYAYKKDFGLKFSIWIVLKANNLNILNNWVSVGAFYPIRTQQDIDDLQQAFNVMQKDLEVLKEYEESNN